MKQFVFNGVGSASMGLAITGSGTYNAPERDLEMIPIPGRIGDLVVDHKRYKNIPVTYPVSICDDFAAYAEGVRAWLLKSGGYQRLEDDYDPDHFRMALCKGPLTFSTDFLNRIGECSITFDCKPQRFLKAGERAITAENGEYINNPTAFPALPLITVYGSGSGNLRVGSYLVKINELDTFVTLDSEMEEAYTAIASGARKYCNGTISAPEFPVLGYGLNNVSWNGGITKVEIIPRWWTL